MSGLRVAVVGATGAVGREMWRLLDRSSLPIHAVVPYTTSRSDGASLPFRGVDVVCRELTARSFEPVDLVLASAGAKTSREWSRRFAEVGAMVVDNSSAFRTDPSCPLVVPEVNAHTLNTGPTIVANPNCSTIQMVVALAPLHSEWGLASVRVATYQSVSGAGAKAMEELRGGARAHLHGESEACDRFSRPIAFNVIPHIGSFDEDGESQEEWKMRVETQRILDLPDLAVSATCVRVPVLRGHSEAIWATFQTRPHPDQAREILRRAGVTVEDDPSRGVYPVPRATSGKEGVFVGRIRRDPAHKRGLVLWVVADNLLKGAASNAIQIVEILVERGLLSGEDR